MSKDIHDHGIDAVLSAGRLHVGPTVTPDVLAEWIAALRADPERTIEQGITAAKLLEYIDAGNLNHITPGDAAKALHSYGWERG